MEITYERCADELIELSKVNKEYQYRINMDTSLEVSLYSKLLALDNLFVDCFTYFNLDKRYSMKRLYPIMLDFLFGKNGTCVLLSKTIGKDVIEKMKLQQVEVDKLYKILATNGNLFKMMVFLNSQENYKFEISIKELPEQLIKKNPFTQRKSVIPFLDSYTTDKGVQFNAYELFIFKLLTYLLRQDNKDYGGVFNIDIYLQIFKYYVEYILPSDYTILNDLNYRNMHYDFDSVQNSAKPNLAIPFFFIELWTHLYLNPLSNLITRDADNKPVISPSPHALKLVGIVLNHCTNNVVYAFTPVTGELNTFRDFHIDFWRKVYSEVQLKLYKFYFNVFKFWNFDIKFCEVANMLFNYLFRWFVETKDGYEVNQADIWDSFIIDNYLFYIHFLSSFIERFSQNLPYKRLGILDDDAQSYCFFAKLISAYNNDTFLKILAEVDETLKAKLGIKEDCGFKKYFPSIKDAAVKSIYGKQVYDHIIRLEGSNFDYIKMYKQLKKPEVLYNIIKRSMMKAEQEAIKDSFKHRQYTIISPNVFVNQCYNFIHDKIYDNFQPVASKIENQFKDVQDYFKGFVNKHEPLAHNATKKLLDNMDALFGELYNDVEPTQELNKTRGNLLNHVISTGEVKIRKIQLNDTSNNKKLSPQPFPIANNLPKDEKMPGGF